MSFARKTLHIALAFSFVLSSLETSDAGIYSESKKNTSSTQKIYIPIFTSQNSHYAAFRMIRAALERGEVIVLDFPNFSIVKKEDILESGGFKLIYTAIHKSSGRNIEIADGFIDKNGNIEKIQSLIEIDSPEALEKLLESGVENATQPKKTVSDSVSVEEANRLFEEAFTPPKPLYYRVLKMAWAVLGLGGLMAWVWFDPVTHILLGLIGAGSIANSIAAAAGFAGMMALRGVVFVEVFGYVYHRFFQHLGFWTRRAAAIRISQRYHWKHHMILYPVGPSYIHESPYKGTEPGLGLSWVIPSIGTGIVSAVIMIAAMGLSLWSVIGAVFFIACASVYGAFVVSVTHARTHEKKHKLWQRRYFRWLSDIHKLHHWDQGYNYTIVHPAMDVLFGTYLNTKHHLSELGVMNLMIDSAEEEKEVIISDLRNWGYMLLATTPEYAAFISNARAHSKSLRKMDTLMSVLRKRLTSYPKDPLAAILYQRGLGLLNEINNEKSRKLLAEYQPFSDRLPGEGMAFQKSGEPLTPRQDALVDEAIRSYFDNAAAARYGFKNEKPADAYALLDSEVYGKLDPDGKLKDLKTLVYVFDDLMFRVQRIANVNQAAVPWGLITHPSTRFGAKLYMDLEHLDALLQLPENARKEWAAHEAAHLEKPASSEEEIQKIAPVEMLVKEFRKFDRRKVNQSIKRLADGDRFEKYVAMRTLRKYGKWAAKAIPRIVEIAEDKDEDRGNRLNAVDTLGVIGRDSAEAVHVLMRLKEDEDPKTHLSRKVLLVLGQFRAHSKELMAVFSQALEENPSDQVKRASAQALAKAGKQSGAARAVLAEFLSDKKNAKNFPLAYREAILGIGFLGPDTPESVRALFGALEVRNRKINLASLGILRNVLPGRADLIQVIAEAAESSPRATARSFAVELLKRERELPPESLRILEKIAGTLKEQGFTRKLARQLVHEAASRASHTDGVKKSGKRDKASFPQLVITRSARTKYDLQGPLYQLVDGPEDIRQIYYSHPGMEAWLRNKGFYRHELVWLGVLHEARHEAIREVNDQYDLIEELKEYLEAAFEGPQGLKNFLKGFYLEFPEGDSYQKISESKAGDQELEALAQFYLNKSKMPESSAVQKVDQALEEMMSRPGGVELGVEEVLVRFLESRNQPLRNHPLLESRFYEERAFRVAGEAVQLYFRDMAGKGVVLAEGRFAGQPLGLGLLEFSGTEALENISMRDQLRNAHRAGFNLRGVDPAKVKVSGGQGQALILGSPKQFSVNRESGLVENAGQGRDILSAVTEWVSLVTESLPKGAVTLTLDESGLQAETGGLSKTLVETTLRDWMGALGLSRLTLAQKENATVQEAVDLFNWLALAVSVSKEDVFLGKAGHIKEIFESRRVQRQAESKEINVKAVALSQIEQDFMDAATREMIAKEIQSGVRYVLIAEKGQKDEEIRETLASSNFDLKWLETGKIILLKEFDPQTMEMDVDSVITQTMQAWGLDAKSFKAYVQDSENTEEPSNFALAVPENVKLTGNVQKVRYFRTRKGVRLSETLTLLHGLLTAPLKVVVRQMKEELLAGGFSQDDIDELLSMEGDVLIPPIQSGSLVNRMVEERKAAEMISWSA